MGFGLHVGWAIEGAIGSEYKIDASYLSPNVNMASRLEAATKQFGTSILMSEDFAQMLSPQVRARTMPVLSTRTLVPEKTAATLLSRLLRWAACAVICITSMMMTAHLSTTILITQPWHTRMGVPGYGGALAGPSKGCPRELCMRMRAGAAARAADRLRDREGQHAPHGPLHIRRGARFCAAA